MFGIYVHTPFCAAKCGYCDFNSYAMSGEIVERCVSATDAEIRGCGHQGGRATTVFFGGGTPTFLSSEQIGRLLDAVTETFELEPDAEITSEANPGSSDAAKFEAMRRAGFNRVSIGAQSFDDDELKRLDRIHKADEIGRAVRAAREAGFRNLSLDLMFALPGQTMARWRENLNQALALEPEHISLYCLTIEPQTKFFRIQATLDLPDEDAQVELQLEAIRRAEVAGLRQYEISNFARPGFECRHNLIYWRNEEYLGFGPGAVSYVKGERRMNIKQPARYCTAVESGAPPAVDSEQVSPDVSAAETLMLCLRLTDGISVDRLEARHPGTLSRLESQFNALERRGWLVRDGGRLRLTPEGRLFHNEASRMFLP